MIIFRTLSLKLIEKYPEVFASCIAYTSRQPTLDEIDGIHYHFITNQQMMNMLSSDRFLEIVKNDTVLYGVTLDCIEQVAARGKICILTMEIEGAIVLKRSNLKTYMVHLVSPRIDADVEHGILYHFLIDS